MECAVNDTWLCFLWNWLLRRFGLVPSGSLKQHPFLTTMFVYLSPSNRSMFPCIVSILAFCGFFVFFLTSVISCAVFSPDKQRQLTIISNYLWPNNAEVWDSQTLHLYQWHHSLHSHLDQHFGAIVFRLVSRSLIREFETRPLPMSCKWSHSDNKLQCSKGFAQPFWSARCQLLALFNQKCQILMIIFMQPSSNYTQFWRFIQC